MTPQEQKQYSAKKLKEALRVVTSTTLKPPPKLSLSEWANEHFVLSPEASAAPGKFHWQQAPYQREMMDVCSSGEYEEVVFCTSAQIGKTTVQLVLLGYFIAHQPCPILVVMPTKELAGSFSKDRLAPMIRDCKQIANLVSDAKSRDSSNTILAKSFPGGVINIVGSNAPSSLASRPVRVVLADEVDRFPFSAGTEGDPLQLAIKRTANFYNRLIVAVSTPTDELTSRIWARYQASDQRKFYIKCVHCEDHFVPRWEHVKWTKDDKTHKPETALVYCPHCGGGHNDTQRQQAVRHGHWQKHNESKVAGFHLSALISPWAKLEALVVEWLTAQKDVQKLKTFMNTQLGEVWQDRSENIDNLDLLSRLEEYDLTSLPKEITLLTAGCDVQDDRIEASVYGFGPDNEIWHVEHQQFFGNPANPATWQALELYLKTRFKREDGYPLSIAAAAIDSGGHFTQETYSFARRHAQRRWFAIKGRQGALPIWPSRASYTQNDGKVYIVGVDSAKEAIYGWLKNDKPGPGYVHFSDRCDAEFFQQLASEHKVLTYRNGYTFYAWKKDPNRRNEVLDCFVYAVAAKEALNVNLKALSRKQERRLDANTAPTAASTPKPAPVTPTDTEQPLTAVSVQLQPEPPRPVAPDPVKKIPKWRQNLLRKRGLLA